MAKKPHTIVERTKIYPEFRNSPLKKVLDKIEKLIEAFGPDAFLEIEYGYDEDPYGEEGMDLLYHVVSTREETEEERKNRLQKQREQKKEQKKNQLEYLEKMAQKYGMSLVKNTQKK